MTHSYESQNKIRLKFKAINKLEEEATVFQKVLMKIQRTHFLQWGDILRFHFTIMLIMAIVFKN